MFDAAIVGAGPAGSSCALWLKQLGFSPVIIDRNSQCGGLQLLNPYLNTWIATSTDSFGADVAAAMHKNLQAQKIQTRFGQEAESVSFTSDKCQLMLTTGEQITSKLLILAGGVTPRTGGLSSRLGLLIGPGHAIANTDFTGATVAILGGGDNAFENRNFTINRGASSVHIFARSIRARAEQLEQVPPEHVTIGDYQFDERENTVNGIRFDHILVLYGYEVHQKSLLGLDLVMRTDGFVSTNQDCLTSHKSVYAIGELAGRMHPCCVTSMADGVVAAKAIQRRLEASSVTRYINMTKRVMSLGAAAMS